MYVSAAKYVTCNIFFTIMVAHPAEKSVSSINWWPGWVMYIEGTECCRELLPMRVRIGTSWSPTCRLAIRNYVSQVSTLLYLELLYGWTVWTPLDILKECWEASSRSSESSSPYIPAHHAGEGEKDVSVDLRELTLSRHSNSRSNGRTTTPKIRNFKKETGSLPY